MVHFSFLFFLHAINKVLPLISTDPSTNPLPTGKGGLETGHFLFFFFFFFAGNGIIRLSVSENAAFLAIRGKKKKKNPQSPN